jgi:hypothetical protein
MSNLDQIKNLSSQIIPLLTSEVTANHARVKEARQSIGDLASYLQDTGNLTQIQRNALVESERALAQVLSKLESAFGIDKDSKTNPKAANAEPLKAAA